MSFRNLVLLLLLLPSSFSWNSLSVVRVPSSFTSWHRSAAVSSSIISESIIDKDEEPLLLEKRKITSALLQISYDGRHFTGWSAANDPKNMTTTTYQQLSINSNNTAIMRARHRRRRRNKGSGFVRSVQGVLRSNLAKLYGNIDPSRVIIEGCSRTDKGVHATGLVAQFYVLKQSYNNVDESPWIQQPSIPGKRSPHPWNATDDSLFEYIPRSLEDLTFALNRMCHDIQIRAFAPVPSQSIHGGVPFHPTRSARWKIYRYTFSVGKIHDPTQHRWVWHAADFINEEKMQAACQMMQGNHDFGAFQGAPRGSAEKIKRQQRGTQCTIANATVQLVSNWNDLTKTYQFEIVGDRFLYKMVRFSMGALVAIGSNKLELEEFETMISTGKRYGHKFPCAPAHALTLHHVDYDVPIDWKLAEK